MIATDIAPYEDLAGRALPFDADPATAALLNTELRTEDLRFSPDGRRLALAGFTGDTVHILDLAPSPDLHILGSTELTCSGFSEPHGIDWFDNNRLVVVNRSGYVVFIDVPDAGHGHNHPPIEPTETITMATKWNRIKCPGSVAIERHSGNLALWICNNYSDRMTYHNLRDEDGRIKVVKNEIKLKDALKTPDGVSISQDNKFMAISNHDSHQVLVYALTAPGVARQIGQLNKMNYPHGLRFTPDGSALVVSDAGQPYLHVFKTTTGWVGDHDPTRQVRVVDDIRYLRGRTTLMEGGIKGLDIDPDRGVVALTYELEPLRFFALADILGET